MKIFYNFLMWFQEWSNPNYWIALSLLLFGVGFLGTKPITVPRGDKDLGLFQVLTIRVRALCFYGLLFIGILLPLAVWCSGLFYFSDTKNAFNDAFISFMLDGFKSIWEWPILGLGFGWLISFTYSRFIKIKISAWRRKFTVRQSSDELSDIRVEEGKIETKNFNPTKYYKKGKVFFGLDANNSPMYEKVEDFRKRHSRLVGPTQTGKGVVLGVLLDQAIRRGETVFFVDPKPDRHAKAIMKKACAEAGRNFVECDLNPQGRGKYAPFYGGSEMDVRSRLMYVLGLKDTGGDGDFYKSTERAILDKLFKHWDGQLKTLEKLLKQPQYQDLVKRSINYVTEFLFNPTFTPEINKGKSGLDIERCLKENAVVYIRGNLDNDVINVATTTLIMEVDQESKRLDDEKSGHVFLAVDEVAFLINEKIADSLATVAGFNTNILLAYQSEGDILNLKDKTQNARAIASRIKTNCKYSLYYMAQDFETAKVMSDESGIIQKAVTRSEKVSRGRHMAEEWSEERDLHRVEENLITTNIAKMLPERVGVLYRPAKTAELCHTSWVTVDLSEWGDKFKDKKIKSMKELRKEQEFGQKPNNKTEKSNKKNQKDKPTKKGFVIQDADDIPS